MMQSPDRWTAVLVCVSTVAVLAVRSGPAAAQDLTPMEYDGEGEASSEEGSDEQTERGGEQEGAGQGSAEGAEESADSG